MAERSPLFLGLVRPPKLLGLPIMYAMVWLFGSVLLFVWVQHLVVLGITAVLYPVRHDTERASETCGTCFVSGCTSFGCWDRVGTRPREACAREYEHGGHCT